MDIKNIVITGASKGVGRAAALKLAGEGANIAVVARSHDKLKDVADKISANGGTGHPIICDLEKSEDIEAGLEEICRILDNRVDVLVNNAGIFLEKATAETSLAEWTRNLDINLRAPFLFCRKIMPLMQKQKSGHIINIASTSAEKGHYQQAAYCAAKHGLLGLSRALALEANPDGVRVNCISPGGINTDFIAGSYVAERIKNQSVLEPENVADMIQFILQQPDNVDLPEVTLERFKY